MRKIKRIFFTILCLCLLAGNVSDTLPRGSAASAMTASSACVEFIKAFEGFSPQPYYDYKQYTVGYGTKCPTEKYFVYTANGIPKKEAEALLQEALADISDTINQKLIDKYGLTLTQHQFDALVSFSFNVGTGWMTYDSTLRNAILRNASSDEMVYAFSLYCTAGGKYLPGLVTRRLCEANVFLNGSYSKTVSDAYGYVYYDANGGTLTYRVQGFVSASHSAPAANAMRSGDVFLGWYTALSGGTQVTTLDRSLTGKTLFAHWQSAENTEDQTTSTIPIKVTGDVVNLRSGPGTNYPIIRQVYRNTSLNLSHVSHITNMRWGNVQEGWICLDYTNYDSVINGSSNTAPESTQPSDEVPTPDEDPTPEDVNTGTPSVGQTVIRGIVNVNDFLRIRSSPGTTYATVGYLYKDNSVDILEQTITGTMVWGRIANGWVCMDYIITDRLPAPEPSTPDPVPEPEKAPVQEPDQPPVQTPEQPSEQIPEESPSQEPEQGTTESVDQTEKVEIKGIITADALRIRSGASTSDRIVGFYYQNDTVVILEKVLVGSVYWGKTDKGWINMDYVLAVNSGSAPSQPAEDNRKTVIGDCLRIRKEPGTNHKIVAFLYFGDKVTIYETQTIDGVIWGRVDRGWVCMDYVK